MPRLVDRSPHVEPARLIADLVAPKRFAAESFATYRPDRAEPTQAAAVAGLQSFAARLDTARRAPRFRFRRSAAPEDRAGIYLDGGFGVGKTHLLASLFHAAPQPRAFGTFVEYTHLVGALGFSNAVRALQGHLLVCIDEFELDDPGDTVLMSSLLNRLVDSGVRLAATSNTLPDRLGEQRFSADDFLREIQGLAAHFDVYRVAGEDYRHRGRPEAPAPLSDAQVRDAAGDGWLDDFDMLMDHLAVVHPSRYGALLDGVPRVHLLGVRTLTDQAEALRLVVLADRLYDRAVPVVTSGVPLDRVFSPTMLRGGYRKKYYRAVSRLVALAREGDTPPT